MAGENLPENLDLDADDGEDLIPQIGPVPKIAPESFDSILFAQNRALERVLQRQNLIKKVYGGQLIELRRELSELKHKEETRAAEEARQRRWNNRVAAGVGAVGLVILGAIVNYSIKPVADFFGHLLNAGRSP